MAAYKRRFRSSENAMIQFSKDLQYVTLYARREVVEDDDWDNPYTQIEISEAKSIIKMPKSAMKSLSRLTQKSSTVPIFKQENSVTVKTLKRSKRILYSEFKDKVGEVVIGYYQRLHKGNIYVSLGKTEGIIPKRYQSPREHYEIGDRIKVMIWEVKKSTTGLYRPHPHPCRICQAHS